MKQSGFGIIELSKNKIPPEAHAMNNSITKTTRMITRFLKRSKDFFQIPSEKTGPENPWMKRLWHTL